MGTTTTPTSTPTGRADGDRDRQARARRLTRIRRQLAAALAVFLAASLWPAAGPDAAPPAGAVAGFGDVFPQQFHARPVAWMATEGITQGTGVRRFDPDLPVTRGQFATFLWREAGSPRAGHASFADVPAGAYFSRPVGWLQANRLTTGVDGTNRYLPHHHVTRGELATFLWRQAGSPAAPPSGFVDVPGRAFYAGAVHWLRAERLTTGVDGSNRFEPNRAVTRGEAATFLYRRAGSPPVDPGLLRVDPPPPPRVQPPPPNSGSGRRIVYSNAGQRVWLVDANGTTHRTWLVSGRRGVPRPGSYTVFSKSPLAWAGHSGITMTHMVRFAWGNTAAIGFHGIPRYPDGRRLQSDDELGEFRSAGCVRQNDDHARYLYDWAPIGTRVVVLP